MLYHAVIHGKEYTFSFTNGGVSLNGTPLTFETEALGERTFSVLMDGQSTRVVIAKTGDGYEVLVDGKRLDVSIESQRGRLLKKFGSTSHAAHTRMDIHAPMPALVVKVEVKVGDDVQPDQGLIILEAMKMENEIKAHAAGKVKEIFVTKGTAVEKGELLMRLE